MLTNDSRKILDVLPARAYIVVYSREFIAPYIRNVWLIWLIVNRESKALDLQGVGQFYVTPA